MIVFNLIYILMAIAVAFVYITAIRNHSSRISNIFILFMFILILACISTFVIIPIGDAKLIEWFISYKMYEISITFLPLVWFLFVYEYLDEKVNKKMMFIFGGIYLAFFVESLYKNLDKFTIMFFERVSPANADKLFYVSSKNTLYYFSVTLVFFAILMRGYFKKAKKKNIKVKKEIVIITILILLMIISEFYIVSQILYSINVTMFIVLLIALILFRLVVNNDIKNLIQISNSLILDELPTIIMILNDEKNVVYANKNAIKVFGDIKLNAKYDKTKGLDFISDLYRNESFEYRFESKVVVHNHVGKELTFIATSTVYNSNFDIIRLHDVTAEEKNIESLHRKSRIDGLTELLNKSTFFEESNGILEWCSTLKQTCAIIMIDLDKFKNVNDTYGHQKGDEVLIKLAKVMLKEITLENLLGRFGGEEFCGLLVGEKEEIIHVLDDFREKFKNIDFEYEDTSFNVTLSIGVAFNSISNELDTLLDFADQALYQSKNNGRDKITVYEQDEDIEYKEDIISK